MRFALGDGGYEPVGSRIIVLPQSAERAALRDPKSGLPISSPGSTPGCGADGRWRRQDHRLGICHGPALKGLGEVPGITGRPATYMFRQLNDMKTGNRSGPWVELMKPVVAKLSQDDMIALRGDPGALDP